MDEKNSLHGLNGEFYSGFAGRQPGWISSVCIDGCGHPFIWYCKARDYFYMYWMDNWVIDWDDCVMWIDCSDVPLIQAVNCQTNSFGQWIRNSIEVREVA